MAEPFRCDLCNRLLHSLRLIRCVALPEHTRMIWQGQCTRHDVSPHIVRIVTQVVRLEAMKESGDGWREVKELEVLGDFDFEDELRSVE